MHFFMNWLEEALEVDKEGANACVLSTVNSDSIPSSRVVLLKDVTEQGFVFFTNYIIRRFGPFTSHFETSNINLRTSILYWISLLMK